MEMRNTSRSKLDEKKTPRIRLLRKLLKNCFHSTANHSTVVYDDDRNNDSKAEDGLWCPRTFDGFSCWDRTPAGTSAIQNCPKLEGFDPKRFAFKRCTEDGTWFVHPEGNSLWTNYTTCVDMDDLNFRTAVNNIYVTGYSVSIVMLFISLVIFFYFRKLQCTRIKIHMHLFTAFTLNNTLWIIWYKTVVNSPEVVQENTVWCQILHLLTNYFMVTSYIWMFCEGLHLHIVLVVVYTRDDWAMRLFMGLGWGSSFVIMFVYGLARFFTPGATERCWIDQSDTFWIIMIPVAISLLTSLVFLINVVRVLLTKLNPGQPHRTYQAVKKAARATMILIPLFGLHFMLIPLRPHPGDPGEKVYQVVSAIITSFQGCCLAILFCFTNHEVVVAVKARLEYYYPPFEGIPLAVRFNSRRKFGQHKRSCCMTINKYWAYKTLFKYRKLD